MFLIVCVLHLPTQLSIYLPGAAQGPNDGDQVRIDGRRATCHKALG